MNKGSKALFLPHSNSKYLRKRLTYLTLMEHKIIDIEYSQLSLQQKVIHNKKISDLSLIIQLLTYRVQEMTIIIGILISSTSLDEKWQDANLSYQHIYKAFKTHNRK